MLFKTNMLKGTPRENLSVKDLINPPYFIVFNDAVLLEKKLYVASKTDEYGVYIPELMNWFDYGCLNIVTITYPN
jgi:hypothetical protein